MSDTVFDGAISGNNVIAAPQATGGGTINISFDAHHHHHSHSPAQALSDAEAVQPFSNVPFPRDPGFIHREDILEQLRALTSLHGSRAALVGLGGNGKSQVAIHYAYEIRDKSRDTYVFWIHASSSERFIEGYRAIAKRLQLPGLDDPQRNVMQLVHDWLLIDENGPWLIIVDNADDSKVLFPDGPNTRQEDNGDKPLASFLPKVGRGSVIVTSRSVDTAGRLVGSDNIIQVSAMRENQALQLLRQGLGDVAHDETSDLGLINDLDCIPLAVTQAAAYIRRNAPAMSVIRYRNFMLRTDEKARLLKRNVGDLRRDESASHSVVTTWHITFEQIRTERESAADLLSFMSLFNPQGIPLFTLKAYRNLQARNQRDHGISDEFEVQLPYDHEPGALDRLLGHLNLREPSAAGKLKLAKRRQSRRPLRDQNENLTTDLEAVSHGEPRQSPGAESTTDLLLEEDLEILRGYSLITAIDGGEAYEMHPLVQLCVKTWRAEFPQNDMNQLQRRFLQVMSFSYPDGLIYENSEICQKLEAHIWPLLLWVPSETQDVLHWSWLLIHVGGYQHSQGYYNRAEDVLRLVDAVTARVLGRNHPRALHARDNLASSLAIRGKRQEAEQIQWYIWSTYRIIYGEESIRALGAAGNLALNLLALGKLDLAEHIQRPTVDTIQRLVGREHSSAVWHASLLARILCSQGRFHEAERMERQVLEIHEKSLGTEHPETLSATFRLAGTLISLSRYKEAEAMIRQVYELRGKFIGREHPKTLATGLRLAACLERQERYTDAVLMGREMLEILERVLGLQAIFTLDAVSSIARCLEKQGKYAEAEEAHRESFDIRKRVLGCENESTLFCLRGLANCINTQGRFKEAEALCRDELKIAEHVVGMGHVGYLGCSLGLAACLQSQNRLEEAANLRRRIYPIALGELGKNHPMVQELESKCPDLRENMDKGRVAGWLESTIISKVKRKLASQK